MDKRWSALFCVLLVPIVSWGAVPQIVRRTPNGEYAVEMTVKTTIEDGPFSDFTLNVPSPKSNQHHGIEWKSPVPPKLLKPYKESGDARIFSRRKIAPKLEGYGWLPVDVTMDLGAAPSFRHFGNLYDHTIVMTQGTNFEVKSAGGRTVLMQFCQDKCWWFWNSGGRGGRPSVSSTIKGTRQWQRPVCGAKRRCEIGIGGKVK